jgi:serine/threonine protein kinase
MISVGDTVRGYTVLDLINPGGFCNAYKVSKGGKNYFLKEYTDPTELSKDFKAFIENQKIILGTLNSLGDSTETIVEHFVEDGHYYQVKELLSGCNLDDWMEDNGEISDRLEAAIQLTKIIQLIHGAGIVHQDLKPKQVMVVSQSPLKLVLTDFDWSVPKGKVVRKVGTPWYGYIDDKPSEKSDIFTLGIILCALLTGATPYQRKHENLFEAELWPRWVSGRSYDEPINLNPDDITKKLNQVIVSCLSPNPSERPSLDEILSVLENPKDSKRMVALVSGGKKLIIPAGAIADRRDFKLCFPETTDKDGNPVYMYVSHEVIALKVAKDGDELTICSPDPLSNKFLLNGKELTATPVRINDGDTIEIFSSKRGEAVAQFSVTVK